MVTRVLVVDDSPTQSLRTKLTLETVGYIITEANNGKTALDIALRERPDVILSDILMPEMDGFELCHLIRTNPDLRQIPVILQTASYRAKEDREFGLDIGADAFIPKGASAEDLSNLIENVIAQSWDRQKMIDDKAEESRPFDALHAQRMLFRLLEETAKLEQANAAIKAERNRAQKYLDVASVMMIAFDQENKVTMINPRGCQILGVAAQEVLNMDWIESFVPLDQQAEVRAIHERILRNNDKESEYFEYSVLTSSGEERLIAWHNTVLTDDEGYISGILSSGEDITDRKFAEIKIRESEEKYHSLFENVPVGVYRVATDGRFLAANPGLYQMLGYSSEAELQKVPFYDLFYDQQDKNSFAQYLQRGVGVQDTELRLRHKQGQLVIALDNAKSVRGSHDAILYYEGTLTDISRLKQAEAELAGLYQTEQQRVKRLSTLHKISGFLAGIHSQQEVMEIVAEQSRNLVNCPVCLVLKDVPEKKEALVVAQSGSPERMAIGRRVPLIQPIFRQIVESGQPLLVNDIDLETPELRQLNLLPEVRSIQAYPIAQEGQILGFIVQGSSIAQAPAEGDVTSMELLAERAAAALDNARLFEEINSSLQRLASLRSIDQAITSSLDINFTLGILLDQVINQLNVHGADILLLDQGSASFRYGTGRGFTIPVSPQVLVGVGNSYAGRAVLERRTIQVLNLASQAVEFQKPAHFIKEGFVSLVCTPLIAKGQVKGVLEVLHREPLQPVPDWISFLETLAGQAAIAIDNAELFTNLQRSNADLSLAYDATIQGWSDALDLRDKETEGHTQRVTELTLKLAELMGVNDKDMVHMRRGCLLHDIGKMGIPDNILLKPGSLSDEEWVIMRKHPVFAYDLISPILYLRPALDIPYCHHEKWDGSGYPRGLKGDQIPLPARIFAVVDVWDALTSDRPYRSAWSHEKTLAHIREGSGSHFDPAVVSAFMKLIAVYE